MNKDSNAAGAGTTPPLCDEAWVLARLLAGAGLPMYLSGPLCELAEIHLVLGEAAGARAALAEARGIYAEVGDVVRAVRTEGRIEAVGTAA